MADFAAFGSLISPEQSSEMPWKTAVQAENEPIRTETGLQVAQFGEQSHTIAEFRALRDAARNLKSNTACAHRAA